MPSHGSPAPRASGHLCSLTNGNLWNAYYILHSQHKQPGPTDQFDCRDMDPIELTLTSPARHIEMPFLVLEAGPFEPAPNHLVQGPFSAGRLGWLVRLARLAVAAACFPGPLDTPAQPPCSSAHHCPALPRPHAINEETVASIE